MVRHKKENQIEHCSRINLFYIYSLIDLKVNFDELNHYTDDLFL